MSLLSFKPKDAPVLRPRKLTDEEPQQQKIFMYGASGTGKTKAITGFLKAGLKVAVLSTEAGGHGLRTVRADLLAEGKPELLDNLVFFDLAIYQEVKAFIENFAELPLGDGKTMVDFNPDLLAWDGLSNFQTNYIDEYVLSKDYAGKVDKAGGQMREEGLVAGEKDWDAIGRVSKRVLDDFLHLQAVSLKPLHYYINAWEYEPATPQPGREVKQADTIYRPALVGATRTQVAGYFDFVFRSVRKYPIGKKELTYEYVIASPDCVSKQRGNDLQPTEPADMEALWKKINK